MSEKVLDFPLFDDIPVSTKTFIMMSNISINLDNLFNFLPITKYVVIPKKRGRRKKTVLPDPNKNIKEGSIITLQFGNKLRGVLLKKKKKKEGKSTDYFRNSVTVVMVAGNKNINFKIFKDGKFQMTGCKEDEHAEKCVKYIWSLIKAQKNIYSFNTEEDSKTNYFNILFIPAMRNIDFSLGFNIDREKLDEFFNQHYYNSLLETSIGYTGVNIKLRSKKSILDLKIKKIEYENEKWSEPKYVPYETYLNMLKPKDRQKKLDKDRERYNTFLIFHSGKCIVSSMCEEFARESYYEFLDIVKENYKFFEERLEEI